MDNQFRSDFPQQRVGSPSIPRGQSSRDPGRRYVTTSKRLSPYPVRSTAQHRGSTRNKASGKKAIGLSQESLDGEGLVMVDARGNILTYPYHSQYPPIQVVDMTPKRAPSLGRNRISPIDKLRAAQVSETVAANRGNNTILSSPLREGEYTSTRVGDLKESHLEATYLGSASAAGAAQGYYSAPTQIPPFSSYNTEAPADFSHFELLNTVTDNTYVFPIDEQQPYATMPTSHMLPSTSQSSMESQLDVSSSWEYDNNLEFPEFSFGDSVNELNNAGFPGSPPSLALGGPISTPMVSSSGPASEDRLPSSFLQPSLTGTESSTIWSDNLPENSAAAVPAAPSPDLPSTVKEERNDTAWPDLPAHNEDFPSLDGIYPDSSDLSDQQPIFDVNFDFELGS